MSLGCAVDLETPADTPWYITKSENPADPVAWIYDAHHRVITRFGIDEQDAERIVEAINDHAGAVQMISAYGKLGDALDEESQKSARLQQEVDSLKQMQDTWESLWNCRSATHMGCKGRAIGACFACTEKEMKLLEENFRGIR